MSTAPVTIFWFRRDLRVDDNHALHQAMKGDSRLAPIFIFDKNILDKLERDDHRVTFIHESLEYLRKELGKAKFELSVFVGKPKQIFEELFKKHKISRVVCNEDYEPYARQRDGEIAGLCAKHEVKFESFKDHVIFAPGEILKDDGSPYRMFTPYWRRWFAEFESRKTPSYPSEKDLFEGSVQSAHFHLPLPTLKELGFTKSEIPIPELNMHPTKLKKYEAERDRMDLHGTTHAGVHLRFGTLSTRTAARAGDKHSNTWLKELAWREFFQQILFHFPQTEHESYDERFKKFPWRESAADFKAWCEGRTGYPIVDAGMRELNQTGFMHNRARMIVGSFLTKHLLLDWRPGERYFAKLLFDFELASNVGNWQWVAGCGCDAAPYFRIFNPALQAKKFDKDGEYVKRWVPEFGTNKYPAPIVDHEMARRRALAAFQKIKSKPKHGED